jgi:hypothetical protein
MQQKKSPRERGLFLRCGSTETPLRESLLDCPPDKHGDEDQQQNAAAAARTGRQAIDLAGELGNFGIGERGNAVGGSLRREAERLQLSGDVSAIDLAENHSAGSLHLCCRYRLIRANHASAYLERKANQADDQKTTDKTNEGHAHRIPFL